ncbi:putative K+ channel, inward rectifier protein [Chondrocystis sp. NIES-4102]|nr:putative K+ channel, inward rectifier protein [Chondrocystis sp. NIES-4102]
MRDEITREGEFIRRFHLLKLIRDRTPRLTLSWTIMHAIDQTSPLWQATLESLVSSRANLVVSLNGIDETVYHSLHARYTYGANDIFFDHRFVDIFEQTPEGHRYLNLNYFDEVESLS